MLPHNKKVLSSTPPEPFCVESVCSPLFLPHSVGGVRLIGESKLATDMNVNGVVWDQHLWSYVHDHLEQ